MARKTVEMRFHKIFFKQLKKRTFLNKNVLVVMAIGYVRRQLPEIAGRSFFIKNKSTSFYSANGDCVLGNNPAMKILGYLLPQPKRCAHEIFF